MALKGPPAYTGDKPHIFVSYAHKDRDRVYPIIQGLQRRGVRVWYDEGLEVGGRWSEVIANNILKCDYVVCFISANFIASENCKNEIHMAAEERKGPLLTYLDWVDLPPEMRLQYGRYHALVMDNFATRDDFIDNLASSDMLRACRESTGYKPAAKPAASSYTQPRSTSSSYSSSPSSSYSSSSSSSSYSSYKSKASKRRSSGGEIPGFIQVLMLIITALTLLGSVICLFFGSRTYTFASLACAAISGIFGLLIFVCYKKDWGFDYMEYSDGWLITALGTAGVWLIALCVGIYFLVTIYGMQDMTIRDNVLVKSYVNESTVEVPDGVVEIGKNAFAQAWQKRGQKIRCIVLPDSVEIIDDNAFGNMTALKEIYIGEEVESIGAMAFYGCTNLQTIYFRGTQEQWDAIYKSEGLLQDWNMGIKDCQVICLGSESAQ